MKYKYHSLFIIVILMSWALFIGDAFCGERKNGAGVLTERSSYGEVVIGNRRYLLDPSAVLLDDRDKNLSYDTLPMAGKYYIEYEVSDEMDKGVIKFMKLLPE